MAIKPIKPNAVKNKKPNIPGFAIDCVNKLIKLRWDGFQARIPQREIVDTILEQDPTLERADVFEGHWLNFEEMFREAGWNVLYDGPAYNEDYEAYFLFTKPRSE